MWPMLCKQLIVHCSNEASIEKQCWQVSSAQVYKVDGNNDLVVPTCR